MKPELSGFVAPFRINVAAATSSISCVNSLVLWFNACPVLTPSIHGNSFTPLGIVSTCVKLLSATALIANFANVF